MTVGLLPIGVLALASVLFAWISYDNSNAQFERTLLSQKRAEVQREVQRRIETFQIFVPFDEVSPISFNEQQFLAQGILEADSGLEEVAIIQTLPGDESRPPGRESERCVRDEEVIDCSVPLRNLSDDDAYRVARDLRQYVSSVIWEDGEPKLLIAHDIRNKPKTDVIGVITGKLSLQSLQILFDEAAFGEEGSVYLTDRSGLVLAHSDGEELREQDAGSALADVPADGARIISAAFGETKALTSGLTLDLDQDGTPDWWLVAEWPWSDAYFPVLLLAVQFFLVGLTLLLVVQFVSIRFSRSIVSPIRQVAAGAERIGKGEFTERIDLHTEDEMEDLGDALNRMAVDLAKLSAVREAETRAQALAVAVQREQQLEEEKDTLLATASHQFRTPVTALNWNIDLLKTMSLPDDAAQLLDGLKEHTHNLATIASDLLNATAFGAGYRAQPDAQPVDLVALVEETLNRFATELKGKSLTVKKKMPAEPVLLRGSMAAIRIAVEHIIGNAILYSDDNGEISMVTGVDAEGRAVVQVSDHGIGIPQDEQQFLFNPFFRAKNAIVKKNVGTGLGLFIVHNVISGHGGTVDVVSEEGSGTTVTIGLPAMGAPSGTTSAGPVGQEQAAEVVTPGEQQNVTPEPARKESNDDAQQAE